MVSLTPEARRLEATSEAAYNGFFNGVCTLIPSAVALGVALQNKTFRSRTTFQSRTAICIMPAMFVTALSSELFLSHRMKEIAQETQHSTETVKWAEEQFNIQKEDSNMSESQHLSALYQQSMESTGNTIVPELHWYHKTANYASQNPIKILAAVGIPTVGYIFYGRADQNHLSLPSKIMHTRVMGQFAVISVLLGVMGFRDYMDGSKYISQQQADDRIAEMKRVREQLQRRLNEEAKRNGELKDAVKLAHIQDSALKKKKAKERKHEDVVEDSSLELSVPVQSN